MLKRKLKVGARGQSDRGREGVTDILESKVRDDLLQRVTFEQTPEGSKE